MTTSLASPQAPGASLQFDATAQGCTSPEYRFWLRDSFGQWQVVQEWGAGPAWIWDTTGLASGAYLISVWTAPPAAAPPTRPISRSLSRCSRSCDGLRVAHG